MPLLGQLVLWLALLLAVWGVVVGYAGARLDRSDMQESARRAAIAAAAAMAVAVWSLLVAAWRQDFHLAYIGAHADRTVPARDSWVVLVDGWAGQWLVAGGVFALGLAAARRSGAALDRRALAFGTGAGMAVLSIVVIVLLVAGRPFDLQTFTPLDGKGLSQRLYDLNARLAAVLRCVAYPAAGIAAAWFAGGRHAGTRDADWASWARAWTSLAWVFLSADLGLSLWVEWQAGSESWIGGALGRPALPFWVLVTAALHGRRAPAGVAAHVTHAGAALVLVGLMGSWFGAGVLVRLRPGESATVGGLDVTYLASSVYPVRNQIITQGLIELRRGPRAVTRIGALRRQQVDVFGRERFAPAYRAGSWQGFSGSVRIGWAADSLVSDAAAFRVTVAPLASWLWLGCWLLVAGGLAALWSTSVRERP